MLEQQIAAGEFHVADEPRGGVDACLLPHEADGAGAVDGDAAGPRYAGGGGGLHAFRLITRAARSFFARPAKPNALLPPGPPARSAAPRSGAARNVRRAPRTDGCRCVQAR